MNITFEGGKLFLDGIELGPENDLTSAQAQEVFKFCRLNQALRGSLRDSSTGLLGQKGQVDQATNAGEVSLALPKSEKVVFFPGSFSPWHKGHLACISHLPKALEKKKEQGAIQNIVVLPDFNPWKEVREEGLWPEVQEIWRGLKEVSSEREDLRISLYLGFLCEKTTNPTVEWLPQAIGSQRWLLMGEDTFLNLHKWKEARKVINSLEGLYVCPRAADEASVLSQKKELQASYKKELTIEFLSPHPYQNYSSTWARSQKNDS